MHVIILIAQ